jgi:hypothetical protein
MTGVFVYIIGAPMWPSQKGKFPKIEMELGLLPDVLFLEMQNLNKKEPHSLWDC